MYGIPIVRMNEVFAKVYLCYVKQIVLSSYIFFIVELHVHYLAVDK